MVELAGVAPASKGQTQYFLQAYQRLIFQFNAKAAAKNAEPIPKNLYLN